MRDHCPAALTMSLHRPHRPEAHLHPGPQARTPVDLRPRRARTGAEAQRTTGRLRARGGGGVQEKGADGAGQEGL
jgi:hypothetical protein